MFFVRMGFVGVSGVLFYYSFVFYWDFVWGVSNPYVIQHTQPYESLKYL